MEFLMNLYRAHNRISLSQEKGQFSNPYSTKPRNPVTMPKITHDICGRWFEERFGINFRARAIFCTGDIEQAKYYLAEDTKLIQIRPIGHYEVCYSERIKDLFDHLKGGAFTGNANSEEEVFAELDQLGFIHHVNNGLDSASASRNEVMLVCEHYEFETVGG